MTHTFTDEEYKAYKDLQHEFIGLHNFHLDVMHNVESYFQRKGTPCQIGACYVCDDCPIGHLIPDKCPIDDGKGRHREKRYSK